MKTERKHGKMFGRVVIIATAIILTGVTAWLLIPLTNPNWLTRSISMARPEASIRRDILRITPLGTSKEDVINVIKEREWHIEFTRDTAGYFMNRGRVSDGPNLFMLESGDAFEVGTQSIRIGLANFYIFGIVDVFVDVYYAFDEDSKLIDVAIRRP